MHLSVPMPPMHVSARIVAPAPNTDAVLTQRDPSYENKHCPTQFDYSCQWGGAGEFTIGGSEKFVATGGDDCCALCRATPGCQFFWFMHYIYAMECHLFSLERGPVGFTKYNKGRCGINAEAMAGFSRVEGGVRIFEGVGFSGADVGSSHYSEGYTWPVPAGFKNGQPAVSWRDCADRCRGDFGHTCQAFTWLTDKRCFLKFIAPWNMGRAFEIVKKPGAVSGVIVPNNMTHAFDG